MLTEGLKSWPFLYIFRLAGREILNVERTTFFCYLEVLFMFWFKRKVKGILTPTREKKILLMGYGIKPQREK